MGRVRQDVSIRPSGIRGAWSSAEPSSPCVCSSRCLRAMREYTSRACAVSSRRYCEMGRSSRTMPCEFICRSSVAVKSFVMHPEGNDQSSPLACRPVVRAAQDRLPSLTPTATCLHTSRLVTLSSRCCNSWGSTSSRMSAGDGIATEIDGGPMPVNPRFGTESQVSGLDRHWPAPPNVRVTNLSFNDFAEREPEGIAIHDARGRRWSRGELCALINQTARALGAAGLRPGDAIAIVSPNCAEYLAVYLAAIQAGLFIVPVNWHLAKPEQDFIIEDSGAKAIVAHERLLASRLAELAARASRGMLLIGIGGAPGYVRLSRFIAGQSAKPCAYPATGRAMSYTSATTGKPKAVRSPSCLRLSALHPK